uniref:microtubule-actin cross-linking factor 1-like isoform X2 n=1 Tax=Halichoerus grypus TaxID=9711 RepID=UPI00165A0820|nr:microtubule-actin cross-linking factor 1-like isoform X2 [Halichoerus grypus]
MWSKSSSWGLGGAVVETSLFERSHFSAVTVPCCLLLATEPTQLGRGMNAYKYQKFLEGLNNLRDERDRVQKKTFTKWVNKHLMKVRKHINDLYEDLRDGHNLISLLEVLSGIKLPREKGRMRFHRLQNVQIALDFLKQRQVR